ncbi:hypothetical protein GC173_10180 [bacterium]|nr:hypothetical protein [bacterium]
MARSNAAELLWHLEALLRRRSLTAGILKAVGRFLSIVGVLMLCGWSYSLWGSAETPMKGLLIPGLVFLAGGWLVGITLERVLRTLQGQLKVYLRTHARHRASESTDTEE